MTLRVTFDLEEADLKFFRTQMNKAKKAAKDTSEDEIIAAAKDALKAVKGTRSPRFVTERLKKIDLLTKMLVDKEWNIEGDEAPMSFRRCPTSRIPRTSFRTTSRSSDSSTTPS